MHWIGFIPLLLLICCPTWTISGPVAMPSTAYLNVTQPASQVMAVPYLPALFSPVLKASITAPLSLAYPDVYACTPLSQADMHKVTFSGTIMLVQRGGGCGYGQKALYAQQAGAIAVVIYNCPSTSCDPTPVVMRAGNTVNVATVWIPYVQGVALQAYLQSAASITAPAVGFMEGANGALAGGDISALQQIVQQSPGTLYDPERTQGVSGLPWQSINSGADPCVSRFFGLWCVNQRIVAVTCYSCGFSGALPDAFGLLTAASYLDFSFANSLTALPSSLSMLTGLQTLYIPGISAGSNNLVATIPDIFANMQSLNNLQLPGNFIVTVPVSLSMATALQVMDLNHNQVKSLPSLSDLSSLTYIDLSYNQISSMPSLSGLNHLDYLDMSYNQIQDPMPSFQLLTAIGTIQLSHNNFTGGNVSTFFDGLASLVSVDLSYNQLSGGLPNFSGSNQLIHLFLGYNQFSGVIPATWSTIFGLLTISLTHNQLVSPIPSLYLLTQLQTLDLSYNQLTNYTGNPTTNGNVGFAVFGNIPPQLANLDMSNNRIVGTVVSGFANTLTQLQTLKLANNGIDGGIPNDLLSSSKISLVDMSYNSLSGALNFASLPPSTLQVLNLQGNPLLYGSNGQLPSWMAPSVTMILDTATKRFTCPQLRGTISDIIVSIDPSFYDYQYCVCVSGTYSVTGLAKDCQEIPISVNVQVANQTQAIAFTDNTYGHQRQSQGVDTSWVLQTPSNSTDQVVRAINITFVFNPQYWKSFTDVIEIYQGGSNFDGQLVATGRGNNPGWISAYQIEGQQPNWVVVFGPEATVNFRSYDVQGEHFTASYTYSTSCPAGYIPDNQLYCIQQPDYWTYSPGIATTMQVLAALVVGAILISIAVVLLFRHTVIIKSASVSFCMIILVFDLMLAAFSILYTVQPDNSPWVCQGRQWFTCLGIVGILAPLLSKTHRINVIFNSNTLVVRRITNRDLLMAVGSMMIAEVVFLAAFSGMDMQWFEYVTGSGTSAGYVVPACGASSGYNTWLWIQVAYIISFVLWGTVVCFKVRKVPNAFNESFYILCCLGLMCLVSLFFIPLDMLIQDDPDALVLIRAGGQLILAGCVNGLLFGPKIYYLWLDTNNARAHDVSPQNLTKPLEPNHTGEQTTTQQNKAMGGVPIREISSGRPKLQPASRGALFVAQTAPTPERYLLKPFLPGTTSVVRPSQAS